MAYSANGVVHLSTTKSRGIHSLFYVDRNSSRHSHPSPSKTGVSRCHHNLALSTNVAAWSCLHLIASLPSALCHTTVDMLQSAVLLNVVLTNVEEGGGRWMAKLG